MKQPRLCTCARSSELGFDWQAHARSPALEVAGEKGRESVSATWTEHYYQKKGGQTWNKQTGRGPLHWWRRWKELKYINCQQLMGISFLDSSLFLSWVNQLRNSMDSPLGQWLLTVPPDQPTALLWPLAAASLDYVGTPSCWPHSNSLRAPEPESGSGRSIFSTHFSKSPWLQMSVWTVYDGESWLQVCSQASQLGWNGDAW